MAVSIRREKPEEMKENGSPYNYRIIFRTSEVSEEADGERRGGPLGVRKNRSSSSKADK